ncbi:hypothetical protein O1L55_30380, partial [Streptomyces albulus]|nr:hypothetical protein [Streptomyces noursei]
QYFVQFGEGWVFNLDSFVVVCVFAFIVKRFRVFVRHQPSPPPRRYATVLRPSGRLPDLHLTLM